MAHLSRSNGTNGMASLAIRSTNVCVLASVGTRLSCWVPLLFTSCSLLHGEHCWISQTNTLSCLVVPMLGTYRRLWNEDEHTAAQRASLVVAETPKASMCKKNAATEWNSCVHPREREKQGRMSSRVHTLSTRKFVQRRGTKNTNGAEKE